MAWSEWDDALKFRKPEAMEEAKEKYAEDIAFYKMLQYLFFKQWTALKAYANEKGIRIIGDVPIYVAMDSADVWANPTQFYLDKDFNPIEVAGCPPDAFSALGQSSFQMGCNEEGQLQLVDKAYQCYGKAL